MLNFFSFFQNLFLFIPILPYFLQFLLSYFPCNFISKVFCFSPCWLLLLLFPEHHLLFLPFLFNYLLLFQNLHLPFPFFCLCYPLYSLSFILFCPFPLFSPLTFLKISLKVSKILFYANFFPQTRFRAHYSKVEYEPLSEGKAIEAGAEYSGGGTGPVPVLRPAQGTVLP